MRKGVYITWLLLGIATTAFNQMEAQPSRWLDSVKAISADLDSISRNYLLRFPSDSALVRNFPSNYGGAPGQLKIPTRPTDVPKPLLKLPPTVKREILALSGGFISYDFSFRSALDTPFLESNLSQHFVTARYNATINGFLPVTITYAGRQSNSNYFRDYHDVRVELNAGALNAIRTRKISESIQAQISKIERPELKSGLDQSLKKIGDLDRWLSTTGVENKLKEARARVLFKGSLDSLQASKDSGLLRAIAFLEYYEALKAKGEQLSMTSDSLRQQYANLQRRLQGLSRILANPNLSSISPSALYPELEKQGVDTKKVQKAMGVLSGIRSFGIGRVLPNHTDLTLKNINIRGVNIQYERRFYFALSAGAVDFRARDFFYRNSSSRQPQLVYLTRFGWGEKLASHVFVSAFRGKKQLLSGKTSEAASSIYGFSLEGQLRNRGHLLTGEVAQSAAPSVLTINNDQSHAHFNIRSAANRAWSIRIQSSLPKIQARIDAYYRKRGINFQNFSSYYTNANMESWQARYDQYLFRRQLRMSAAVSKNSFENNYLPVRYNSAAIYKSLTASYRRRGWPSFQVNYMPSSQLSEIDGRIYENLFHSFSGSVTHNYPLGLARGISVVSYNRFFNDASDSGFIYYNARNFYLNQSFLFSSYTATFNLSRSISNDYRLTVMEGSISTVASKLFGLGLGVKINQLNPASLRVGMNGRFQLNIQKLGELTAIFEKAYLPGSKGFLINNEMCTIHFLRYFK